MGIVKISDELHEDIRRASAVMGRSINGQAEFWIKIGLLAELHPDLTYQQLTRKLLANPDFSIREVLDDVG